MNLLETHQHSDFIFGARDLRMFTNSLDLAHRGLFDLVNSDALNINPDLKNTRIDHVERWIVHGENHALFAGLYVHFFGSPYDGRPCSPLSYFKAGYEHDIGKMESHPDLWDKPKTQLTPEEQKIKWSHVFVGEDILKRYEKLGRWSVSQVEKSALSEHHERLDGSGGPRGLKGEQISPVGRLFALVDQIFSRMEGRPDCDAMTLFEAVNDVRRHSERYDPNIAKRIAVLFSSNVHMSIPGLRLSLGRWDGKREVL